MTSHATRAGADHDERRSQTDVVVSGIKRMIVEGRIGPGSRLPVENDLADELGVSRGSLREGVRALAAMGVLQVRQGSGTYVSALDSDLLLSPLELVVELYSGDVDLDLHVVRRVLEAEACAMAATRITAAELDRAEAILGEVDLMLDQGEFDATRGLGADLEFHHLIALASGNPILQTLVRALSTQTVRGRMWRALEDDGSAATTHHEHRAILAALHEHDVEKARLRMMVHLLGVEEFLVRHRATT